MPRSKLSAEEKALLDKAWYGEGSTPEHFEMVAERIAEKREIRARRRSNERGIGHWETDRKTGKRVEAKQTDTVYLPGEGKAKAHDLVYREEGIRARRHNKRVREWRKKVRDYVDKHGIDALQQNILRRYMKEDGPSV